MSVDKTEREQGCSSSGGGAPGNVSSSHNGWSTEQRAGDSGELRTDYEPRTGDSSDQRRVDGSKQSAYGELRTEDGRDEARRGDGGDSRERDEVFLNHDDTSGVWSEEDRVTCNEGPKNSLTDPRRSRSASLGGDSCTDDGSGGSEVQPGVSHADSDIVHRSKCLHGGKGDVSESDISGDEDNSDSETAHSSDDTDRAENGHDMEVKSNTQHTENSTDVEENQQPLSGPHRRHVMARQQRRQIANSTAPPPRRLNLTANMMAQWRAVGRQWGVESDDDIARILMRNYEDLMAGRPPRPPPHQLCEECGEVVVPLPCGLCGPHQHSSRLSSHSGHPPSSGGRGSACGRCRD